MSLDSDDIRSDFAIFDPPLNDSGHSSDTAQGSARSNPKSRPIAFLDSAASAQKPRVVVDTMADFSHYSYANVHRGAYELSQKATSAMEAVRAKVARFLGATDVAEVIFTKNATESFNLLASSFAEKHLGPGDVVVLSVLEHHANIVPWQIQARRYGFDIVYIECDSEGRLITEGLDAVLSDAKLLSITAMSNVTGVTPDLEHLCSLAKKHGVQIAIDASQYAAHKPIDVRALDCDYLIFTGHKLLGPSGVGVLWGRRQHLEELPVFLGGGAMITDVTRTGFTSAPLPAKFEAGTPPIIEIIGLGAALDYLDRIGVDNIASYCDELSEYFLENYRSHSPKMTLHGPVTTLDRGPVFSFEYGDIHPHDLAQVLDSEGVCVRAGHHCAKPLMAELGIAASTRASLYLYNNRDDIDRLFDALNKADTLFGF